VITSSAFQFEATRQIGWHT